MASRDWLVILLLALLWGASFTFTSVALRELPSNTLVVARMGLATPPLLFYLWWRGERLPRDPRLWGALALLGLVNIAIPFGLFFWAMTRISGGLAAVLNATTPLWGVVFAHYLTREERITPLRFIGTLLGFVGIAVIIGPGVLRSLGGDTLAQLACLVATAAQALAALLARRISAGGTNALTVSIGQCVSATLFMLPVALLLEAPWQLPMPGMTTWLAVIALALPVTALAYILFFGLLERVGTSNALLIAYLIPVFAVVIGGVFLGEVMAPRQFGGMALIALALAVIDGRPFARLAPRRNVP